MSDVLRLPESECARVRGMLSEFVDGELGAEQSAWFGGHLEACAECRAALDGFTAIDGELTAWGQRLGAQNPQPPGARDQLSARLGRLPARRWAIRWTPAAAATIAAAVALAVIVPRNKQPAAGHQPSGISFGGPALREQARFIEVPYLPPLDPRENTAIVRMNIRVATLITAGYRVAADPGAVVSADVLVGEDGRAHAVRVLSNIAWSGTGD